MRAAAICPATVATARNTHFGYKAKPEDQHRIQHDIDNRSGDLCHHRQAHISLCLQNLCPAAFQKEPYAAHTDDSPIHNDFPDDIS